MPKLIENVLIGGRVRLAGEDVSEADARGIRLEVFAKSATESEEQLPDPQENGSAEAEGQRDDSNEQVAAEVDQTNAEPVSDEPVPAKPARGRSASKKG